MTKLRIEPLSSDVPSEIEKSKLVIEFEYLPEVVEYSSLNANYENQSYWYGAGELMIYTGFGVNSGSLSLNLFARNREEGKSLMERLVNLRKLVMPLMLKGDVVWPPPRWWLRFVSDDSEFNRNEYRFDDLKNLLVRFEDVSFRIVSAFEDMTPRLVEVNLTYKEVAYPYRTLTMI